MKTAKAPTSASASTKQGTHANTESISSNGDKHGRFADGDVERFPSNTHICFASVFGASLAAWLCSAGGFPWLVFNVLLSASCSVGGGAGLGSWPCCVADSLSVARALLTPASAPGGARDPAEPLAGRAWQRACRLPSKARWGSMTGSASEAALGQMVHGVYGRAFAKAFPDWKSREELDDEQAAAADDDDYHTACKNKVDRVSCTVRSPVREMEILLLVFSADPIDWLWQRLQHLGAA